ncbi:hypothetical protein ABIC10_009578 [Bradyrhizobium sp. S3.2.12]
MPSLSTCRVNTLLQAQAPRLLGSACAIPILSIHTSGRDQSAEAVIVKHTSGNVWQRMVTSRSHHRRTGESAIARVDLQFLMDSRYFAVRSSILPSLATHLLKKACWSRPLPFVLPAAGLPDSRGGNCLAMSALHFRATSAVTANAGIPVAARTRQANPSTTISRLGMKVTIFSLLNREPLLKAADKYFSFFRGILNTEIRLRPAATGAPKWA